MSNTTPPPPSAAPGNYGAVAGNPPSNNLVLAIVSILFCWPLAIFAIISSTKVNTLWQQGDAAGAQAASGRAKRFALISIGLGVVGLIVYIIMIAVVASSGVSTN